ncbi:dipeptidase, partial [Erysipelatoclostridium ramosum]
MERLEELKKQGVSLMTILWNYENCIGYPNSRDRKEMASGLKPFGIEVVERMGELGMIVDVSHASDGTSSDVLKYAKGPVVASHSNCRA